MGFARHWRDFDRLNFEYYYSSHPCSCSDDISIEDCLIGYFCCCCSIIQVTLANDERYHMKSKVEGDVNIKHAFEKKETEALIRREKDQF